MVINALQTVYDPEIPVIIYDLGLIYKLEIANSGNVRIEMTLTALGCPVAGILPQQVAEAAASIDGIGEVEVYLGYGKYIGRCKTCSRSILKGLDVDSEFR